MNIITPVLTIYPDTGLGYPRSRIYLTPDLEP